MKAVAITVVSVGLLAVGGNALKRAVSGESCWSPAKIESARFSLRGLSGSIRSFELNAAGGCVFHVKIELDTPSGARTLDYDAKYSGGDRPIFLRYNSPP